MTNTEQVPGYNIIEQYGIVQGSTIRAKHVGRDIMAGLKNIVGGELKGYTQLLQESREEFIDWRCAPARHRVVQGALACERRVRVSLLSRGAVSPSAVARYAGLVAAERSTGCP